MSIISIHFIQAWCVNSQVYSVKFRKKENNITNILDFSKTLLYPLSIQVIQNVTWCFIKGPSINFVKMTAQHNFQFWQDKGILIGFSGLEWKYFHFYHAVFQSVCSIYQFHCIQHKTFQQNQTRILIVISSACFALYIVGIRLETEKEAKATWPCAWEAPSYSLTVEADGSELLHFQATFASRPQRLFALNTCDHLSAGAGLAQGHTRPCSGWAARVNSVSGSNPLPIMDDAKPWKEVTLQRVQRYPPDFSWVCDWVALCVIYSVKHNLQISSFPGLFLHFSDTVSWNLSQVNIYIPMLVQDLIGIISLWAQPLPLARSLSSSLVSAS